MDELVLQPYLACRRITRRRTGDHCERLAGAAQTSMVEQDPAACPKVRLATAERTSRTCVFEQTGRARCS